MSRRESLKHDTHLIRVKLVLHEDTLRRIDAMRAEDNSLSITVNRLLHEALEARNVHVPNDPE